MPGTLRQPERHASCPQDHAWDQSPARLGAQALGPARRRAHAGVREHVDVAKDPPEGHLSWFAPTPGTDRDIRLGTRRAMPGAPVPHGRGHGRSGRGHGASTGSVAACRLQDHRGSRDAQHRQADEDHHEERPPRVAPQGTPSDADHRGSAGHHAADPASRGDPGRLGRLDRSPRSGWSGADAGRDSSTIRPSRRNTTRSAHAAWAASWVTRRPEPPASQ